VQQALLIVLGAAIAAATTLLLDITRERRQRRAAEVTKLRDLVELYLPNVLDLLAAARWLQQDMESEIRPLYHENPYPRPPEELKVPGHWYPQVLRLRHHPLMPESVQTAAGSVLSQMETWNAIVEDHETAESVATKLVERTEELVAQLETAGTKA
jgi:hypothetical protein